MKYRMFLRSALLLAIVTSLAFATGKDDAAERKKLVGLWRGYVVDDKGQKPDDGPVKLELRITEESMSAEQQLGKELKDLGKGKYALDLSQKPAVLDATEMTAKGKGRSYQGIYVLEGDTLKWCVSPPGKGRPSEFRTKGGQFLLILKRQKE